MDPYNVLIEAPKSSLDVVRKVISEVLLNLTPEILVVDSPWSPKEILQFFPEEMSLKCVNYNGTQIQRFLKFCDDFPNEWMMLVHTGKSLPSKPVERYKLFWSGATDSVFVPGTGGTFELSGHLLFLPYFAYRKMDSNLNLLENLFELCGGGVKIRGIQGLYFGRRKNGK